MIQFSIIANFFQAVVAILLFLALLLALGHFIANFSVGKIKLLKNIILGLSIFISVISFLLIYTETVPIIVLITILASIRWAKYVFQNYPFIESVRAIVDFGTSLFLTVCTIILWIIFEFSGFNSITFLKFSEFFLTAILLPLIIIFTICFNEKKEKKKQNVEITDISESEGIKNYYIDFSSKVYRKMIMKFERKEKTC